MVCSWGPYKNQLQNTPHVVLHNRPTLSIAMERLTCLNILPWGAAGDPRLTCGRSRVRALAPPGVLRMLFSPPSLPSSFGRHFFNTFPTTPVTVLGLRSHKGHKRSKGKPCFMTTILVNIQLRQVL